MDAEALRSRINHDELKFAASRSGGPGGQNVNKLNTKVELRFNIPDSTSLNDDEKKLLFDILKNRITSEGELLITSQTSRSQLKNRETAEEKFFRIVSRALTPKPERKATRPTLAAKKRRVDQKKKRSLIKSLRKSPGE